jgi:hypothetical protein
VRSIFFEFLAPAAGTNHPKPLGKLLLFTVILVDINIQGLTVFTVVSTMSSSSAHSSSGPGSSHPDFSHSDSLLQLENNNIKEHEDTLSHPKDILPQPEDALTPHETTLPHLADTLSQPKESTMSGNNRSRGRNVHIFDESDRRTSIGGLKLPTDNTNNNLAIGVTNSNLYTMIEVFVFFKHDYVLRDESNTAVEKDDSTSAWKLLH